jgi:uncharacterized protein (TIGR02646 family)
MIRIVKPKSVPEKLKVDGRNKTKENCRAYSVDRNSFISEGKTPKRTMPADNKIYGNRKEVKALLVKAQNNKCCYCERDCTTANLHVEHYRPKTRVKQALMAKVHYPGYYWLTYEWNNLFLACHECNSTHKGDLFPLADGSIRARSHREKLSNECPLIIKPSDQPRSHIRFNLFGLPEPLSPEGDQTIRDLGLLREDLVRTRLEKLVDILAFRVILENAEKAPRTATSRQQVIIANRRLKEAVSPNAEFSAMAEDVLSQTFNATKHLLKLQAKLKKLANKGSRK